MGQITINMIRARLRALNGALGVPCEPYTERDGGYVANVGTYHIDQAYGSIRIVRMATDSGAIDASELGGYGTKRETYDALGSFMSGMARRDS